MQEAAEAAKRAAEVRDQLLQTFQRAQEQGFKAPPKPPSADMLDRDPIRYWKERARFEEAAQEYHAEQTQMRQLAEARSHEQQQELQARQSEALERLRGRVPDLFDADPAKREATARKLTETATHYGFSVDELNSVQDDRAIALLSDAAKWRALQAGKAKALAQAKTAPAVKPGGRRPDGDGKAKAAKEARTRLRKSGSVDDVAAWLLT